MTYQTEIIIHASLDEVIKKIQDPNNLKHWQKGLISYDHLSGVPGQVGAKMLLVYYLDNTKIDLVETIVDNNLPTQLIATYDTKGLQNIQKNRFERVNSTSTKWISHNEFVPTGFMMRLMTVLTPKAFRKQTVKYMEDFKNFAEKGTSVFNEKNKTHLGL